MTHTTHSVITDLAQITPTRLTQVLQESGCLHQGTVKQIRIKTTGETTSSRLAHLAVTYTAESSPSPPKELFFKHTKPIDQTHNMALRNQAEAQFYLTIAKKVNLPVPSCYHIGHSKDWHKAHFFMEDFSTTHQTVSSLPDPSAIHLLKGRVETLARLHAYWWEHPSLGKDIGRMLTCTQLKEQRNRAITRLSQLKKTTGNDLSSNYFETFQNLLSESSWNRLNGSIREGKHVTLTHGDPHGANFLYPKNYNSHDFILIDWQAYEISLGAYELAHMLGLAFSTQLRRKTEKILSEHYYKKIQEHVLYSWKEFEQHYRLGIALCPLLVLAYWNNGMAIQRVWHLLDRAFNAYGDWGCNELF